MRVKPVPYEDADDTRDMADNASECAREYHLANAARRIAQQTPATILSAPKRVRATITTVSDSAASFAGKLFN